MAQPSRKPVEVAPTASEIEQLSTLRSRAVAIDPPPDGAIGIKELLDRFACFAEAGELVDSPENSAVGVRELLDRLGNLADAGYFSSTTGSDDPDEP
jgi:hypothetical protein